MTNKLLLFSVACACNLALPTYYEATRSRGSRQISNLWSRYLNVTDRQTGGRTICRSTVLH